MNEFKDAWIATREIAQLFRDDVKERGLWAVATDVLEVLGIVLFYLVSFVGAFGLIFLILGEVTGRVSPAAHETLFWMAAPLLAMLAFGLLVLFVVLILYLITHPTKLLLWLLIILVLVLIFR